MNDQKKDTAYCPSCGKNVKIFGLLAEGDMLYRCMQCGMEVDPERELDIPEQSPHEKKGDAPNPQPQKSSSPPQAAKPAKKLKYIMIAEDSKLLSEMIKDILIGEGFTEHVSASLDGDMFIQKFTESMIMDKPPNLIILDINLPAIDGLNICVAIRAIERAFGQGKSRPILFFTAREADATLKKIMETYPPARYINKGREGDPEKLAARMKMVMQTLLK